MTPGARVQAAIEILDEVFAGKPAEKALTGWARRSRYAGSKDRAAVRDHVYDALRRRNSAAAAGGGTTGRAVMLGVLRLDLADPATVFSGQPYAPDVLSEAESDVPEAGPVADVPDWLIEPLMGSLGDGFETYIKGLRHRAPITLRVNLQKSTRPAAQSELLQDGIDTQPTDIARSGLLVTTGARKIAQSRAYREGLVELQDASSQAAVQALDLRDNMSVLDFCAGGGGKLLAMAGQTQARFFAHDAYAQRMRDLAGRAARAGVNVTVVDIPARHAPYDLVFCDVPCSGSGTWRRTPDAKWRFTEDELNDLLDIQSQILKDAAALVKPGGTLVYATCSVLNAENGAQVAGFLENNQGWSQSKQLQLPMCSEADGFFFTILTRE